MPIPTEASSDSPWGIYADVYDLEFDDSWTARDLPLYLREAEQSSPILELACGTGRLAIPLARAGLPVVGLDACPIMLARAREKVPELAGLRLVQGQMQDFQLDEQFGLAIIALGSFYDLRTLEAQEATLRSIRRHLKPDARLIIDLFLPTESYVGRPVARPQSVDLSGCTEVGRFTHPVSGVTFAVSEAAHHIPHEQTFTIQRIIESFDRAGQPVGEPRFFRICGRYVHRYEMQHLLRLCGFDEIEVFGDYDYAPFDAASRRMIWIAKAG